MHLKRTTVQSNMKMNPQVKKKNHVINLVWNVNDWHREIAHRHFLARGEKPSTESTPTKSRLLRASIISVSRAWVGPMSEIYEGLP